MRNKNPTPSTALPATAMPAAAAVLAAAVLALSACGGGVGAAGSREGGAAGSHSSPPAFSMDNGMNGMDGMDGMDGAGAGHRAVTVLDQPFTKPDLVLTDTHGRRYDLRAQTKGRPTLLYFGYTHCPDICPLTMSNIALAKQRLPEADQDRLRVVFVSTDPERDTPAVLARWLRPQDPDFVGLTGRFASIQGAARQVGITVEPPRKDRDGSIVSVHGTEVVAFSPKSDGGYLLYGEEATVDDYTRDLPDIVEGRQP